MTNLRILSVAAILPGAAAAAGASDSAPAVLTQTARWNKWLSDQPLTSYQRSLLNQLFLEEGRQAADAEGWLHTQQLLQGLEGQREFLSAMEADFCLCRREFEEEEKAELTKGPSALSPRKLQELVREGTQKKLDELREAQLAQLQLNQEEMVRQILAGQQHQASKGAATKPETQNADGTSTPTTSPVVWVGASCALCLALALAACGRRESGEEELPR